MVFNMLNLKQLSDIRYHRLYPDKAKFESSTQHFPVRTSRKTAVIAISVALATLSSAVFLLLYFQKGLSNNLTMPEMVSNIES